MSCFFPPIFKKNTYKKVRFFTLCALVSVAVLLFSGCRIVKGVASAPFKAVGWGANKVSEAINGGGEPTVTVKGAVNSHTGLTIDGSGPTINNGGSAINFDPLVIWAIILVGIALIVRFLFNRYVAHLSKK